MNNLDNRYLSILTGLKEKIRSSRLRTLLSANAQMLVLYWEIGNTIAAQEDDEGWGAKTIERLSIDLKTEFTDSKGFSTRNLRYMRDFAVSYPDFSILQHDAAKLKGAYNEAIVLMLQAVAQLPWGHHIVILTKVKVQEARGFYVQKAIENNWNRQILSEQIEGKLLERSGAALNNFALTLPERYSDLANETFKNPYLFDFLAMDERMQERDLEKALIAHLKNFMLELGKGFSYVGNQYQLKIAGDDFFLDLLFYNIPLRCFVLFELKIGEFKPEFAGKLNFYVNAVDAEIKTAEHQPTIGILLCKTPNETVVKYALQGIHTPMGVAEYELADALPGELKGGFPTIEELEKEIDEEYEELKSPTQKRFEALKERMGQLKDEEIKHAATTEILFNIINNGLQPLFKSLIEEMHKFQELFYSGIYNWEGPAGTPAVRDIDQFVVVWKSEELLRGHSSLSFYYNMDGFLKAGTKPFGVYFSLNFFYQTYYYGLTLNRDEPPVIKKLYHENITREDIDKIIDIVSNYLMSQIESGIMNLDN